MAHIAVSIGGVTRAAIVCDGYDVVAVNLGGTRVDEELATVHVSSSKYPEQGVSTYLIWVDEALVSGQRLSVAFSESGPTVGAGKTIDEVHPEDSQSETETETNFVLTAEMMQELRAKPQLRTGWRFELRSPGESDLESRTTDVEHGFGFNVLWNTYRPERASFSLHSYDLGGLQARSPMHDHARGHLKFGEVVELVVAD